MTNENELDVFIGILANARANRAAFQAEATELMEKFQASPAWKQVSTDLDKAKAYEAKCDEQTRAMALLQYELNKDKHPHECVEIKETIKVEILDKAAAFEWCKFNYTPCLKLDEKEFTKAAGRNSIPGDLAAVTTEAKAFISSDLSKFA